MRSCKVLVTIFIAMNGNEPQGPFTRTYNQGTLQGH